MQKQNCPNLSPVSTVDTTDLNTVKNVYILLSHNSQHDHTQPDYGPLLQQESWMYSLVNVRHSSTLCNNKAYYMYMYSLI